MKVVILAGGLGTRISEETHLKPKPMVEIGGKPILWHIMKIYSAYGLNEFIICCGYKGYLIKEYFANYFLHMSDVTFDMVENKMEVHNKKSEPWKVTLVDTGETSQTGGRLKKIAHFIEGDELFFLTYGDGLANINITAEVNFHKKHGKLATLCSVVPPGRYGALDLYGNIVRGFAEKPPGDGGRISGGFFILSPKVINYIDSDYTPWEGDPLIQLAKEAELMAFNHDGFWQPMDTQREKVLLDELWNAGNAPWKVW